MKETKWVKIDGLKTFTLKPSDLGWNDESYAYRFTYYVTPVNKESFGQATANNRFELKGEVGRGKNKFNISEIYSQTSVNISGNYSMNIRKEAWHYEKAKADATKWKNGKLYWVIEVDGTAILKDTAFKDEIVSNTTTSSLINSYLHSDSLVGIYIGKLEDGKTITDYKTLEELQASEKLKTVTDKFTSPQFENTDTPLAGANFTLKKEGSSEAVSLISIETPAGKQGDFYRVAVTGETGNSTVITGNTGKFTIQGLDAGRYYLTETQQPAGYNKLKDPIEIVIEGNGDIKVDAKKVDEVKVENNTGSLLPSTGGMGTTLFYIFGAILVIGSGVVLITKKRMK